MRGNQDGEGRVAVDDGSIPACAGEPPSGAPVAGKGGVYPRVCGGTMRSPVCSPKPSGLSPRVRGNRIQPPGTHSSGGVYPRACGGTVSQDVVRQDTCGLSPRVRGNPSPTVTEADMMGSIPARAGEPLCRGRKQDARGVYPRACGGTTSTLPT